MSATWFTSVVRVVVVMIAAIMMVLSRSCYIGLVNTVKVNLAVIIYLDNFNFNNVANRKYIFNLANTTISHARDMKKTIFTRSEANKSTEIFNANYFTVVDFSNFRNFYNS